MDESNKSETKGADAANSNEKEDVIEPLDLSEVDDRPDAVQEAASSSAKHKGDIQFDLQDDEGKAQESPRAPLFVAGRSPRYVNQSPRKGDPGTLIYEATSSGGHSPSNISPRVQLFPGAANVGASQHSPVPVVGSPGTGNVMMSPLRFGQSPVSMSPPGGQQSLEELMRAAEAASNYKLAHDIATDSDFKLSPRQIDPNSLEGRIKAMMEKAFWDMLRDDLESGDPTYEQALGLLAEIKETVLDSLLKPQNCAGMAQQFREKIDLDLIKQQIDTKSFDLYQYSNYIIDVMAKLCAPCRDARIAELRKTTDVVLLFREILKTLDLMKLDMANFLIAQTRPLLQQHSVEYEREKFEKLLATQKDEKLQYTKEWLYHARERLINDPSLSNKSPANPITVSSPSPLTSSATGPSTGSRPSSASSSSGPTGREILHEAFMELLDWRQPVEKFPETCILDVGKFKDLSFEYKTLVMTASVLLVSLNSLGVNDTRQQLVETIKKNINDVLSQSPGLKSPEDVLEGIVWQTVKFLQTDLKVIEGEEKAKFLQTQLTQLSDSDHAVKKLLQKRIQRYLKACLDSATHSNPAAVPAALVPVQKELSRFTAQFLKVSSYNREVFRPHYTNIIDDFTMTID